MIRKSIRRRTSRTIELDRAEARAAHASVEIISDGDSNEEAVEDGDEVGNEIKSEVNDECNDAVEDNEGCIDDGAEADICPTEVIDLTDDVPDC